MGEISEGNTKLGHLERTVDEPRDLSLHHVTIKRIDEVNPTVRLFRLEIHEPGGIKFLPGQWLDVYVPDPSISQAGGFTITCSPSKAIPSPPSLLLSSDTPKTASNTSNNTTTEESVNNRDGSPYPYLELAIQQSPLNPVASYLWQSPLSRILNKTLKVRVGGSFVFPPFPFSSTFNDSEEKAPKKLEKVIFIAGGVGVNPLMSMLSYIGETFPSSSSVSAQVKAGRDTATTTHSEGKEIEEKTEKGILQVHFLYSVKDPNPTQNPDQDKPLDDTKASQSQSHSQILFLTRISSLFSQGKISGKFKLFLTQPAQSANSAQAAGHPQSPEDQSSSGSSGSNYPIYKRRISKQDIASALGADKDTSAVYICGVPAMTDYFVELLTLPEDSGGFVMDTDRVLFEKWW